MKPCIIPISSAQLACEIYGEGICQRIQRININCTLHFHDSVALFATL